METSEQFKKSLKQNLSKTNKIQKICKVIKPKTKRGVRGKRKCVKEYKRSLRLLGVNAAGLKCKFTSFKKVVSELKPSVFFVQETKMKYEGQINLGDEYIVYELLRKNGKGGGGLAIGCLKDLNPCWVKEGTENVEVMSIDIYLKNMRIRCTAAYGPQECDEIEKKEAFWNHLDREVDEAKKSGSGFILQFDGNLWAGSNLIPGDPRPQNKNGKLLELFLKRNPTLSIVNSLPQCQGLVTRSRLKNGVLEESILDFFIVCSSVLPFVKSMVIDESKNHILTNYRAFKNMGKAVDSDHYTLYLDMDLEITKEKPERQEIFNFKDKKSQEEFKINTTETNEFTACFNGEKSLSDKIENWRKVLISHCTKAFKKIRIRDKKMKPLNKKIVCLINKRNYLKKMGCVCETQLPLRFYVKNHKRNHAENIKYQCDQCKKVFKTKTSLNLHEQIHIIKKVVCTECGKQFEKVKNFSIHRKMHEGKTESYCCKCNIKFKSNTDYTTHKVANHTKQSSRKTNNIKPHKEIHTETCLHCGKDFQSRKCFKNHLRVHRRLQKNKCEICEQEIYSITAEISEEEALENRNKILKQFKNLSENPENINLSKMWKILKNICPKLKPILPSAKKNHKGKIISSKNDIKSLLKKEYKNRLRSRPYRSDLISTKLRRNKLFDLKLKLSKRNKTKPWTTKDLEKALKDLKRNKSRDSEGLVNEIFKTEVIGTDLKNSLLNLCNNIKKENMIPDFMNYANITTVPKKGPKIELKNQRGIFRVSVIRSILMRLIYNSKYEQIDQNISDGQMGARKGKGCKHNIWIINGLIHETLKNKKKKPIVLQIYDYSQMFDSINLKEALNDIFDYGLDDDNLPLVFKANDEVHMAIKTLGGLTERQTITNSVLQGDTFGSLLASVQVDSIAKDVEKAGVGLKYKDEMVVNILGLVDDMIGVSEVGFKAQIMNTILNFKSAEKGLQFGTNKCKMMIIGHHIENLRNNPVYVDCWKEEYIENSETGEIDLNEKYIGEVPIEQVQQQKYLGFTLSSRGNNLANIEAMEKKSVGVIRTIMSKLENLKLRQYYFECSKIFMNVILRASILYASECYYNLTENNLRRIEKIEENFMRKIFKTTISCPITQMYLEYGQWPARFEIMKLRCLFLKTILQQDEQSQLYRFFLLQKKYPIKGDWVSTCFKDLLYLEISETLEEIKIMPRNKFKNLVKNRIQIKALEYLQTKRGSKGEEIEYKNLEMSEFLLPFNSELNIEEKQKLFEIRNRMTNIPSNFGKKEEKCRCGAIESMQHIYSCELLNENQIEISYDKLHNGNLKSQIKVFRRMKENLEIRNKMKTNNFPCDPSDPSNCTKFEFG